VTPASDTNGAIRQRITAVRADKAKGRSVSFAHVSATVGEAADQRLGASPGSQCCPIDRSQILRASCQWPPTVGKQPPSRVIPPESTSTAFTLTVPQAQTGGRVLSSSYPPNATLS
jgi:hypothetical protein